MPWSDEHRRIMIVGVLLLAALLRFQDINQPYVDYLAWKEATIASMADAFAAGNWNILLPQIRSGGPGPNYIGAEFQTVTYIAAIGYQAFGRAPWVGRVLCVAFGLWGIFALYQLVRRVWDTPRGIASAAVMAVLPGSVFIERSFVSDGAMTALMTTSLWMLVTYCQTEKPRYLVAAALAGMLGCLTKLPGGILVIPAIYTVTSMFGLRLRERRIQLRLTVAALVVAIPVIAYYLWARHLAWSGTPHHFTGQGKFLWDNDLRSWLHDLLPNLRIILTNNFSSLPFVALAIVGLLLPNRAEKGRVAPWLFHFWLLAMAFRYLIEHQHLSSDPQNLHMDNPVIAAFAGHALVGLANGVIPFWNKAAGAFFSILIFSGAAILGQVQVHHLYYHPHVWWQHYILGRNVAELSRPTDLVITMGWAPVVLYHSQRNGWVFPALYVKEMASDYGPPWKYGHEDVSILRELKAQGGRWLIIPSWNDYMPAWNSYAGGSRREFLRTAYPALYSEISQSFDLVREIPEGLIFQAKGND
jgi:hypothetical protein